MATSSFSAFASGGSANVVTDTEYQSLIGSNGALSAGFVAGLAYSSYVNKVLRQTSVFSAVLGKIIADNGQDCTDSDTVDDLETWLLAAIRSGYEPLLGFTPVQQGGGTNQTTDKVNLGQDSTYDGLLRVSIDDVDHGTLLSGTYLATITGTTGDLPGMGLWFQNVTQLPAFTYQDATGTPKIIDLAMNSDVQTLQSDLSAFQTAQTNTNATLSADISDCVSGVYGVATSAGDTQGKSLYQAGGSGRPTFVYNNGTTDVYSAIAYYSDVTTVQANLTSFQTTQTDQNSTFATEIAAKVSTNTTNDGTNSPITYLGHNNASGAPFVISSLVGSYRIIPSRPGTGYNSISNMSTDSSGNVILADSSGASYAYAPTTTGTIAASGNISGGWWVKTGNILRQSVSVTTTADYQTIDFPIAFSEQPIITFGCADASNGLSVIANFKDGSLSSTGFILHTSWI
ncbi:hypothetical protein, partial [Komagataeibacter oboediens]|uniref:hypothetical protein n=1 Tax=Komagataeibacter oboediens TaxID=65958 RepID=UPI000237EAB4